MTFVFGLIQKAFADPALWHRCRYSGFRAQQPQWQPARQSEGIRDRSVPCADALMCARLFTYRIVCIHVRAEEHSPTSSSGASSTVRHPVVTPLRIAQAGLTLEVWLLRESQAATLKRLKDMVSPLLNLLYMKL